MTITLRQMQYVLALAGTGHFGRAAEQCRVTQPALSQHIRQLEEFCGAPLFDRLGKSVRLTPLGSEFVERARPILEQSGSLEAFLSGQHGSPGRSLRFGLIPTVAPYLLPRVFPALQQETYPLGASRLLWRPFLRFQLRCCWACRCSPWHFG